MKIAGCLPTLLISVFIAFGGTWQAATAQSAAGLEGLVESEAPERIAAGFVFTEGPVWHPDGYLLFSDVPGNIIYQWTPDGQVQTFRSPSGYSNGLTFDKQGRLLVCEHGNRRISRTEQDGTITTLAEKFEGKRLNSPNDVVVKSDGSIYFTDPPYGLKEPGSQELAFQGIYRILPGSNSLELLVDDFHRPNGLAFSPDEKMLYIANTGHGEVIAFDVLSDGSLANRRVFAKITGFPDGVKVDIDGNLYVTNNYSFVQIFANSGKHLGDIVVPEGAENCGFGDPDYKTLFITARTSVYRVKLKVKGIPIFNELKK
jgi:gluconolactonase